MISLKGKFFLLPFFLKCTPPSSRLYPGPNAQIPISRLKSLSFIVFPFPYCQYYHNSGGSDNQRSTLVSFTSLFCLFLPPSILSIPFTSSAATTSASTYPLASFPSPKPLLSTTLPILIHPFYPFHLFRPIIG